MDIQTKNPEQDNFNQAQEHNFYSKAPSEPYTPKNAPISPIKSNRKGPIIALGIILLLIIAYLISSYFIGFWPFGKSQNSSTELFEQVFEKFGEIENASYEAVFTFKITEKEEGMKALEVDYSDIENSAIQRDYQRFLDFSQLRRDLEMAFADFGRYPSTLKQGNIEIKDPSGTAYLYQAIDNGNKYQITITFETQEAIDAIEKETYSAYYATTIISGKQATFSSDGYYYFYSPFNPDKMKPAFVGFIENQGEYFSSIPGNLETAINTSGIFYREQEGIKDNSFSFGGEMEYEDMTLKLSADFMRIDDILYFRLNQIPGIFLMFVGSEISSIKEEWIKIMPEDMIDPYSMFSVFEPFREEREKQEEEVKVMEELEVFFEVALEEELFLGEDNAKKEMLDGKSVFHYELSLNADTLPEFYTALTAEFEQRFGDDAFIKFSENTLKYLEAPQTITVVNYFNQNGKFDLFIEAKTGYPLKMGYQFAFVPESKVKSLKNKQLVFSVELNLKNINKKVKINAPKDFIGYDEAVMSMSGLSEEEYYFQKQKDNISAIRLAIDNFYVLIGNYPENLSDLELTANEAIAKWGKAEKSKAGTISYPSLLGTYENEEDIPFLKVVPKDAYTGMDYQYQKILSYDYTLSYNINLPEYKKGTRLDYNICARAYDTPTRLYLIIVNGLNTADKNGISQEAEKVQYVDSDKDGVTDSLENYIGTDKHNSDTDGDGQTDGYELSKYSDPLGPGQLEYDDSGYSYY